MKRMKTLWAVLMLAVVLFLPLIPVIAQEDEASVPEGAGAAAEAVAEPAVEAAPAPAKASPAAPKASPAAQHTSLEGTIGSLISKVVAMLAPIGAMFGLAPGFRIGGTTGTGIAALVIAKMLEDKLPSWAKYALYAGGGTMFAGGGANIAQVIIDNIKM
jgi:hypothetical protein